MDRDTQGRWLKGAEPQKRVRAIRLSDDDWEKFGDMASRKGISRADLLELWLSGQAPGRSSENSQPDYQAIRDELRAEYIAEEKTKRVKEVFTWIDRFIACITRDNS